MSIICRARGIIIGMQNYQGIRKQYDCRTSCELWAIIPKLILKKSINLFFILKIGIVLRVILAHRQGIT